MTQRSANLFFTPVSARTRVVAPVAFAAALIAGGRANVFAQATPTVESLLESSVTAMAGLDSFAFTITTLNGETQFVEGITLKDLSGAVERPDRFMGTATVELIVASLKLTIISADGRLWFTDPFGDGDTYQEIDLGGLDGFDPTVVINPDRLLLPALSLVESPTLVGEETLEDGTVASRIDGIVNLAQVTGLAGTQEAEELGLTLPEQMPFSVWIDGESLVRRIEATGPILPAESDSIIRRVDLYDFNVPADIQPPV